MAIIFTFCAVIVGCLMPIQASINTQLSRMIKFPLMAAFISFGVGTIVLGAATIIYQIPISEYRKLINVPPQLLFGGILGAIFVGSTIFFIPRIGATQMIGAFVTGQLLMSVIIDHYGLFGVEQLSLSINRVIGVFLLFVGLLLVIKKSS